MCVRSDSLVIGLIAVFIFSGCSNEPRGGPRLETAPLTGLVTVDGKPRAGVRVMCHPGPDAPIAYEVVGTTSADGQFFISTYEAGDGLPPGTYSLTFELLEGKGLGQVRDALGGKYSDPEKSEHKITVVEGNNPALTIDLVTGN